MDRREEIDSRIAELQEELENVEGTRTEIYTRIVGYYRSLKNWNKGKREEYDHRVTFEPGENRSVTRPADAPIAEAFAEAAMEAVSGPVPADLEMAPNVEQALSIKNSAAPSEDSAAAIIDSYVYFFRESCPNCPPVKSYVENLSLDGQMVNVDTGEGMARAVQHQILSTPTVLLQNSNGETVAQAGSVEQLRDIMESAG